MTAPAHRWIRIWSSLFRRRLKDEVHTELDFHLAMRTEEYHSQGLPPKEARERAEARFGDVEKMKKAAYEAERNRIRTQERVLIMDGLKQDLQFALRQLWNRPGFSIIALAMLAIGIGANTAIFSVVQTILLQPLPFHEPGRILNLWESRLDQGREMTSFAPANFWDVRDMNQSFQDVGAYRWSQANLTGLDHPERLRAGRVTAGFFGEVLGVRAVLGRTFLPGEDEPGGENQVALLSNDFWLQRFGGDPSILGTTLTLDDQPFTVVGVLPRGTPWLTNGDVFTPMVRNPDAARGSWEIAAVGRLLPGMTVESAQADLDRIAGRLEELYPDINGGLGFTNTSTEDWIAAPELRRALWILLAAVAFLLLIASVNLANLLLAKATGRVRETAIRAAVGAGRSRLLRQALTESLLLAVLGGGLGVLLAVWGLDLIQTLDPGGIPRLGDAALNRWVLLFTMGVAITTGILTGVVPAFQSSGTDAAETLKAGSRSVSGGRKQRRLRSGLVAAEMALSLTLLIGAGLLMRSFGELLGVERGFSAENRLVLGVNLPPAYGGVETENFLREFERQARLDPRVHEIAAVSTRPLTGGGTGLGFTTPEDPDPEGGVPWAQWRLVTPTYLETMGIPLLRGRFFDGTESMDPENPGNIPVVISQRIAELLWPGQEALGRMMFLWAGQGDRPGEVIGVVGDIRERGLDSDPTMAVYLPYFGVGWAPTFILHTAGEPNSVIPALRTILGEMDSSLPFTNIRTMEEIVGTSLGERRFLLILVGLFAGMALLLALAGVYGVQAYSVSRQTSEIGIRVAMGAEGGVIVRKIMLQAMRPAVMGIVLGLVGAYALSSLMESLLFGVAATDFMTYAGVAGLLGATALVSCWVPALRALKVDPVVAFRGD
jgi:putative ABC transport system permease protein